MRFDFYCENQSGSSSFLFTPLTLWTRGLGGAENGLVGLTEELAILGNEVHVWNTPIDGENNYNGVQYHFVDDFDIDSHYDNFICFRNPFLELPYISANRKIWWSTDQRTCGDYRQDIDPFVNLAVTISPYHRQYHIDNYGFCPDKIVSIDLGVRVGDYEKPISKVPYRLLYCSVPSRGLSYLPPIFEKIKQSHPNAELWISGDFSMWGEGIGKHDEAFRPLFKNVSGVNYVGKLPRQELIDLQLSADVMVYPNAPGTNAYEELFSVATAECQVAGTIPVTSHFGGLQTTVIDGYGHFVSSRDEYLHPSHPEYASIFSSIVIKLLTDRESLTLQQSSLREKAIARFNWNTIARQWLTAIQSYL